MTLAALLDRRLIVVTGKGGVGRTTVAAAIGVLAGRAGKRAAVVEMSGAREVAEVFGLPGRSYKPREAAPGVETFSLTPRECLDDFGARKLRLGMVARRIVNNRVTRAFFEAVPGLHDLQQLGKIENLLNEPLPDDPAYDLIVLDAPATGHGLTLLAAARSMREMTRVGPFADLAKIIEVHLSDHEKTAIVLTTLPEALPVQESLELAEALGEDGAALAAVILNMVQPPTLPEQPAWEQVRPVLLEAGGSLAHVVQLADRAQSQQLAQRKSIEDLKSVLGAVPMFQAPMSRSHDPRGRALDIADALGGAL